MALPGVIRVKISSEAAEYLSLTPVASRDLPLREFLELLLDSVGPDPSRIAGVLRRGSAVSAGSRLRWAGIPVSDEETAAALAAIPGPDPSAAFDAARCLRAEFPAGTARIVIERETARRTRPFRRRCFWDALVAELPGLPLEYAGYSYRERAHRFRGVLTPEASAKICRAAPLLAFSGLQRQLERAALSAIEVLVSRAELTPDPRRTGA